MNTLKHFICVTFLLAVFCLHADPGPNYENLVEHLLSRIKTAQVEPLVIGIGGCPGVGKTTLAKQLADHFEGLAIHTTILHIDDFNLPAAMRMNHGEWNLNHLYLDKLLQVVQAIVDGNKLIDKPTYNQVTGECGQETLDLRETRVLIFEGLYASCSREKLDFSKFCSETIFISANESHIYQWKKARNEERTVPRTEKDFDAHMKAMLHEYHDNIAYSIDEASIVVEKDFLHRIVNLEIRK